MKSYEEITQDIKSVLSKEVSGMQLDVLVNSLSTYVYNMQAVTVSQLLEGNMSTAINTNSIISKAVQFGVSVPRPVNPEVEFEVKSIDATHKLNLGDEVVSLAKFKFLYLGYYNSEGEYIESQCDINSGSVTLIRCTVTEEVRKFTKEVNDYVIYDADIKDIASRVFIYRDGAYLNQRDLWKDTLGNSDILVTTMPDYGVRMSINKFNKSYTGTYNIILPKYTSNLSELIQLIKSKAASSIVTISAFRSSTSTQNMVISNLGSEKLSREEMIRYVEYNLNRTQLIKSNTDLISQIQSDLFSRFRVRYEISIDLHRMTVYVNDPYFRDTSTQLPINVLGVDKIYVSPGELMSANISIKLNNNISEELMEKISKLVKVYDNKFNVLIDEMDLISKINSINPLIHLTEFKVEYHATENIGGTHYEVNFSSKSDLELVGVPDPSKVYKPVKSKKTYLNTNIIWS